MSVLCAYLAGTSLPGPPGTSLGLLTANDPLTSHFDGEEAVCVLLL